LHEQRIVTASLSTSRRDTLDILRFRAEPSQQRPTRGTSRHDAAMLA
jgi:hypothetical protein